MSKRIGHKEEKRWLRRGENKEKVKPKNNKKRRMEKSRNRMSDTRRRNQKNQKEKKGNRERRGKENAIERKRRRVNNNSSRKMNRMRKMKRKRQGRARVWYDTVSSTALILFTIACPPPSSNLFFTIFLHFSILTNNGNFNRMYEDRTVFWITNSSTSVFKHSTGTWPWV